MMEFRVGRERAAGDRPLARALRPIRKTPEAEALRTRVLTIDEYMNAAGESLYMLLNNAHWSMPVTERPALDSTELRRLPGPLRLALPRPRA